MEDRKTTDERVASQDVYIKNTKTANYAPKKMEGVKGCMVIIVAVTIILAIGRYMLA